MAQPSASPTPNVLKPPPAHSLPALLASPLFYPRKEFLRDHPRVVSAFALLTLAGTGFVRLYSFPDSVINGLRRLFDHQNLILSVRENAASHFFEFSLDTKPWANVKNLASEKLIVAILAVVFQYGYSFLSTIEYAREHDDRIAIAFSRPSTAPVNSSIPVVPNPNASCSTLPQAGPLLFAISFPSTSLLRVIEPPLPLTPAILQAVRSAWPRGISYEKKLGDSYEFKLKGYKWFQENTFSADSLQQILTLLGTLDRHSFTLLTSLTVGSRSRTRDLWIFVGPPENPSLDSPPASPAGSSLELKREITPQRTGISPEGQYHSRSASHPSPLKQVTPSNSSGGMSKLKKPFPKAQLPHAFQSESSLNDHSLDNHGRLPSEVGSVDMTGVGTAHRRGASQTPTPEVFYTTGPVQDGNAYQREFNPWNRPLPTPVPRTNAPQLPAPSSWRRQHSRHYSISSTDDPILRGVIQDSPYDIARQSQSSSSNSSRLRRASSPLSASPLSNNPQPLHLTPTSEAPPPSQLAPGVVARHSADVPRPALSTHSSDPPRIPTPPLLGTTAFRDSGLSSSTGWRSTEIPITWTGKDPDPTTMAADTRLSVWRAAPHGPRERRASIDARTEVQAPTHPPLERRGSSGPVLPGSWAPTPKEEQKPHDVVESGPRVGCGAGTDAASPAIPTSTTSSSSNLNANMIPPTIKEQPSQEGDDGERRGNVRVQVPEQHRAEGEGARKSEAAWVGHTSTLDRQTFSPPSPPANGHANATPTAANPAKPAANPAKPAAAANGHANGEAHGSVRAQRSPNAPRASSISEGWVLINIDSNRKGGAASPSRSAGQGSALSAPPLKHQRSHSDSRIPTAMRTSPTGAGKSTMSAAAKAIVMIDAVAQAKEKQQSGGKLRRLLGRTQDKDKQDKSGGGGHASESSAGSGQSKAKQTVPVHMGKARK
ncbi:hypothetical protein BD310DRAFT_296010 [Dichomitus squalens]|uniref:Uncharacterized protein n=1 Tax=Dichomitus squalens TaxID=114155 RepID=A0A4V2K9S1_9APHY|nr:hypothetical protein BD310DRAFT_296010 [Dichomitus squalens]